MADPALTLQERYQLALGRGDDGDSFVREVFDLAVAACGSAVVEVRREGIEVAGLLGSRVKAWTGEMVAVVGPLLLSDGDVAAEAAWALSHPRTVATWDLLFSQARHPDADVRHAVAVGLGGDDRPQSVAALIQLTSDPDEKVRDWALASLGTGCSLDSAEIRQALRAGLADPYADARDEALWGLVRRRDREALQTMVARFRSGSWVGGDEDAVIRLYDLPGSKFDVDQAIRLLEHELSDSMTV